MKLSYEYKIYGINLGCCVFKTWKEASAYIKYCLDYGHPVTSVQKVEKVRL